MLGRTNTGGGGGVGGIELSVVVDTKRPEKPKHNTVWVYSAIEMTSCSLSDTEPENPIEGMVFISIGDFGDNVATTPIGDNWVTIYPISASQYVNGAWATRTAMCYQNGKWSNWWDGTLYDTGDEFESVTGGWYQNPSLEHATGATNIGTVEKRDTSLYIFANSVTYSAVITTVKMVDFTNYKTLRVEGSGYCLLSVHQFTSGVLNGKATAQSSITDSGNIDVSALNGKYYVSLSTYNGKSFTCNKMKMMR